jgi:hypothetical protein
MLLWHSVGTGKTCTAIATATSTFEKQGYTILWVTRTTLKNDIWKNMFDQVCHEIIKLKIENQGIVIPSKNSDRMKLLSKSWRVRPMSYKQFSNLVSRKNKIYETMVKINGKEDPLRKTLLIIDEAHKLYGGGDLSTIETPDMNALHAALMNSYIMSGSNSVKLLLMTATPIQTDPMELIKLINLFKMPDKQLPDNFDLFSEEYLDNNGVFKPQALEKFRNETAGYISYLNREKDARQFSQPIVSLVKTDVYSKGLLKQSRRATRKYYSNFKKSVDKTLKTLKNNPVIKAKVQGYDSLKKICESYEYPKARNACKKIISSYKKETEQKLKEDKIKAKQEIQDYKEFVSGFKEIMADDIKEAEKIESGKPIIFRTTGNSTTLKDIATVYSRLQKCGKKSKDTANLIAAAVSNNPDISELKNKIDAYKQRIVDNSLARKKEKNKETKDVLKNLIKNDKKKMKTQTKKLKSRMKQFIKVVKTKKKQAKKHMRNTQKQHKPIISKLKKLKLYDHEFEDKDLEQKIRNDIHNKVEEIELNAKEKEDNKKAKTMKKMEREQKKLEREDTKMAKKHAKTMKKMEKEKAKEDKEFIKLQKARDAEFKKLEAEAKKKDKEMEKQREKEAKEMEKQREKEAKELDKLREKEAKEMEKLREKAAKESELLAKKEAKEMEKLREKAAKELEKQREKDAKEMEKQREKAAKEMEKQREKAAKKEAKLNAKTMKKIKGGLSKTRRRR